MTTTEYRAELEAMRELANMLSNELNAQIDVFDQSPAVITQVRALQKVVLKNHLLRRVHTYVSQLGRWFHGSRIGNPPTL